MGVWVNLFAAPHHPGLPQRDRFTALLEDLYANAIVEPCWEVTAGDLADRSGWEGVRYLTRPGRPRPALLHRLLGPRPADIEFLSPMQPGETRYGPDGAVTLVGRGDDVTALVAAITQAGYGQRDVTVELGSFQDRPEVLGLDGEPSRTDVHVHAPISEVTLTSWDEYDDDAVPFDHPAQWHLTSWGKGGPWRVDGQLQQILARHFGPDLVSGTFYS